MPTHPSKTRPQSYSFGSSLNTRSFSAGSGFRFGFNGKEKDDEISGDGNNSDYGFRIYNPRLGKFLSVDPLFATFPWLTPYQYASNRPIVAIDLDGLESVDVSGSEDVGSDPNEVHVLPTVSITAKQTFWQKYGGVTKIGISIALDFIPGVGTVKGIVEAFTGKDLITGEKLKPWERALGIIPIVGKLGREVKGVAKIANSVDAASDARRATKGISNARRGTNAVDFLKREMGFPDSKGRKFTVDVGAGEELRYVDNFSVLEDGTRLASELKVGKVGANAFTKNQVLKDIQLLKEGKVDKVEWNFFTSAQTGKGGANDNLKNFIDKSLKEAGVDASKFELKPVRTESF